MALDKRKAIPRKQGSSEIARPELDMGGGKGSAYGGCCGCVKEKKGWDCEENNEEKGGA